jgi:hypothetical protein
MYGVSIMTDLQDVAVEVDTLNSKKKMKEPAAGLPTPHDNTVDVDVEEAVGVTILGILFFFILMAFLRSQKRERKLLREMAEMKAELVSKKA